MSKRRRQKTQADIDVVVNGGRRRGLSRVRTGGATYPHRCTMPPGAIGIADVVGFTLKTADAPG